jgi:hypothetical protein
MKRLLPLLVAAMLLPAAARAQQLTVEKLGCKKGVHLAAHGAKLSAVLAELGRQLDFAVHFEGDNDRPVDVDMTHRGPELVARLMQGDSVISDDAPDPRCPGQVRLTRLWVLPKGEDGPVSEQPRELTPMEIYRKAHGLPLEDRPKPPVPGHP